MNEFPNIPILYEDDDIVLVDKPPGLMVHGDGRSLEPTLSEWFVAQYPEAHSVGEEPIETKEGTLISRAGIVHRLDRDTTGVMLLAKTQAGHTHLKDQFQAHTVQKVYRAIVYGHPKEDSYLVDAPIGRAKTFGRWTAIPRAARGTTRNAETQVAVIGRFEYAGDAFSYVEARPTTGRTHQIRVHMQYLNHPVVADQLYAGKRNKEGHNLHFTRHALHAYTINFTTLAGTDMTITAPLPDCFTKVLPA